MHKKKLDIDIQNNGIDLSYLDVDQLTVSFTAINSIIEWMG